MASLVASNPTSLPPQLPGLGKANAAMVLLGLAGLADAAAVATGFLQYSVLSRAVSGLAGPEGQREGSEALYALVGLLQLLLYAATAVVFCLWFHRAHKNLPLLGAKNLQYSPAWAAGGFFVPILNLVRPYQVAKEIWECSEPESHRLGGLPSGTSSIAVWWGLFLSSTIVSNIGSRIMLRDDSDSTQQVATGIMLVADALSVGAAAAAIWMTKSMRDRQAAAHQRLLLEGFTLQP